MRDSTRYREQAEAVMRLAAKAASPMERDLYVSIAEGWRKLAGEAARNEDREHERRAAEPRSFADR